MKKIEDLKLQDFSDIDSVKFEEWKNQRIVDDKKLLIFRIVFAVFYISLFIILISNKIYLGFIPLLFIFGIRWLIESNIRQSSDDLQKQLGINNTMLQQVLRN